MSKRIKADRWEKILQEWKESGESKASFCRRNNISLSTFSYHVNREKNKESASGAYTGPKRTPIPEIKGQLFRSKADRHSGNKRTLFEGAPE